MKYMKMTYLILIVFSSLYIYGCSKNQSSENKISNSVESEDASNKIDLDLSKMSSTIVYSEVFNMLIEPDYYENKRMRMKGLFTIYSEDGQPDVYAVIIPDATACCQQGIEFKYNFKDQIPQDGAEITITGIYKITYDSENIMYAYLDAEDIKV